MSERELVKVVTVDEVIQHPNADALEIAIIGGWQCCVKLGEFVAGSKGVYFEIDSMLPLDKPEFEFLAKRNEREFEGKVYSRIRTMKLRGELSQGLLLPMTILDSLPKDSLAPLQELLGVVKYEPVLAACLSGIAKGNFPAFLRKSDQERCVSGDTVVITEDGQKCIKEICETTYDGKIKSYNHDSGEVEWGYIEGWNIASQCDNWVKIITESGRELLVTDDHKIFADGKGYVQASDLKIGDTLVVY